MENLINKVIEALEMRLGEGYTIIPKDKRKNNGLILHGICICREGDSISRLSIWRNLTRIAAWEILIPKRLQTVS